MKKCFPFLSFLSVFILSSASAQQFCDNSGNVIIYSNYDGGALTINIDQNIPNLKVGICSYEDVAITFTGAFVGNVTEVRYAGYQGDNDNCNAGISNTTITGVPVGITTILFAPPATVSDPNGYGSIICGYSCGTDNQGGCNTIAQVAAYFTSVFNGNLRYLYTQYNCWNGTTKLVSAGGNCCPGASPNNPIASFNASSNTICAGSCINFTNTSSNSPTSYSWSFSGAVTTTSSSASPQNICYNDAGTFMVSLTATNSFGSNTATASIIVDNCPVPGCTYSQATNYNPLATEDNGTCIFGSPCGDCAGDLDNNGVIGVGDLLIFISIFGTSCPN